MTKLTHIWIGVIPDIFGYGISVASLTEDGAMKALRNAYNEWKVHRPNSSTTFSTSFENFGGRVERIELNKSYCDNFGE